MPDRSTPLYLPEMTLDSGSQMWERFKKALSADELEQERDYLDYLVKFAGQRANYQIALDQILPGVVNHRREPRRPLHLTTIATAMLGESAEAEPVLRSVVLRLTDEPWRSFNKDAQ